MPKPNPFAKGKKEAAKPAAKGKKGFVPFGKGKKK